MADLIPVCPAWERCGGGFKCQTNVTGIKQKYTFFLWDMTVKYNMSTYFCWKLWMAKKKPKKTRVCTFLHKHTWILYLNHPAHVGMVITDKWMNNENTKRNVVTRYWQEAEGICFRLYCRKYFVQTCNMNECGGNSLLTLLHATGMWKQDVHVKKLFTHDLKEIPSVFAYMK